MKQIREHLKTLKYLKSLKSKNKKKKFIQSASNSLLKSISSIALNICKKNIPLTESEIKKLKRFEKEIKLLAERKHSMTKRKKILGSGGVLNALLSLLPTLIGSLMSKYKSIYKK